MRERGGAVGGGHAGLQGGRAQLKGEADEEEEKEEDAVLQLYRLVSLECYNRRRPFNGVNIVTRIR